MTNAAVVGVKLSTHIRDPANECKRDMSPLMMTGAASASLRICFERTFPSKTQLADPDEYLFRNVANRRDGCTIIAVFEVKKEIPI